jgi:hypothetical protein
MLRRRGAQVWSQQLTLTVRSCRRFGPSVHWRPSTVSQLATQRTAPDAHRCGCRAALTVSSAATVAQPCQNHSRHCTTRYTPPPKIVTHTRTSTMLNRARHPFPEALLSWLGERASSRAESSSILSASARSLPSRADAQVVHSARLLPVRTAIPSRQGVRPSAPSRRRHRLASTGAATDTGWPSVSRPRSA